MYRYKLDIDNGDSSGVFNWRGTLVDCPTNFLTFGTCRLIKMFVYHSLHVYQWTGERFYLFFQLNWKLQMRCLLFEEIYSLIYYNMLIYSELIKEKDSRNVQRIPYVKHKGIDCWMIFEMLKTTFLNCIFFSCWTVLLSFIRFLKGGLGFFKYWLWWLLSKKSFTVLCYFTSWRSILSFCNTRFSFYSIYM